METLRIKGLDGQVYRILPREGHAGGRNPGYAIWERTSGGALIFRGSAATLAEAKRMINSGFLVSTT